MPHIHTQPGQHDHSACGFIVRWIGGLPCILFLLHKELGKLLPPGGHIELEETPWQGILHEIEEETGYFSSQLKVLQPQRAISKLTGVKVHPAPVVNITYDVKWSGPKHHHSDSSYVFFVDEDPESVPHEGESTDLRWLTQKEIAQLDDSMTNQDVKEIAEHIFTVVLKSWKQVDSSHFVS